MKNIKEAMSKYFKSESSISVPESIYSKIISDPDFPFLISFPRTGSHWLRMLMELYFEKPSLVRIFFNKNFRAKEFTCIHRHDTELEIERKNIIYLYREPAATVFSQIKYYKEDPDNNKNVEKWTRLYARHLSKWLFEENFSNKKTILNYENMLENMAGEFEKVCNHLNAAFDEQKLNDIMPLVSKHRLKKKTKHDKQVVDLSIDYESKRIEFIENNIDYIYKILKETNNKLLGLFA